MHDFIQSPAIAFLGGAALVLLIWFLVTAAVLPPALKVEPVILDFFVSGVCRKWPKVATVTWQTQDAAVVLLQRNHTAHAFEVAPSGHLDVEAGRWTLVAVGVGGKRIERPLVVAATGTAPQRIAGRGSILAGGLALMLGALTLPGCGGTVQQLRQPIIHSFKAEPAEVPLGQSATLTWVVSDAARISLEPPLQDVTGRSQFRVSPRGTTIYVLTVTSADGLSARASLELPVYAQTAPPQAEEEAPR